tara:strand:+ start:1149 stop:1445 length:297 start_codon:yes stop_codon:yes gene_type:complete
MKFATVNISEIAEHPTMRMDAEYWIKRKEENNNRTVKTIGENSKTKKMTRKVDTWEYESLAECIKMDQVPATELAEIFTDKAFYKYYKKNWLDKSGKK